MPDLTEYDEIETFFKVRIKVYLAIDIPHTMLQRDRTSGWHKLFAIPYPK